MQAISPATTAWPSPIPTDPSTVQPNAKVLPSPHHHTTAAHRDPRAKPPAPSLVDPPTVDLPVVPSQAAEPSQSPWTLPCLLFRRNSSSTALLSRRRRKVKRLVVTRAAADGTQVPRCPRPNIIGLGSECLCVARDPISIEHLVLEPVQNCCWSW